MLRKIVKGLSVSALLMLVSSVGLAQPGGSLDPLPCDPDDLSAGCTDVPLDTWIIFLVIAAVCFGAWYLNKNQKRFFVQ